MAYTKDDIVRIDYDRYLFGRRQEIMTMSDGKKVCYGLTDENGNPICTRTYIIDISAVRPVGVLGLEVDPEGQITVAEGDSLLVTMQVDDPTTQTIESIVVDGTTIPVNAGSYTYTFDNVHADHTLVVNFA